MCAYKTGCLARMSARLAVILSGGSEELEEKIGKVAEAIGVGFQIQDDVLSASGGKFQKKKGYGDDITEGKRTLMVVYALKKASPDDRKRLIEILNMHTRDEKLIDEAISMLNKYNAVEYAKKRAREIVKEAWEEAESLLKESKAKQRLREFVYFLIEREI
jgi:geranylgeranyl diphosphate synthase type I